jgi:hypothetical protein
MEFIADILMAAGAIGAGIYCIVLGRRLNRFNDLEKGVGGAVAVLSAQVDDLDQTLNAAQRAAEESANTLTNLAQRAEDISRRLGLQMASLHDIPAEPAPEIKTQALPTTPPQTAAPMFARRTHPASTGDIA